MLQYNNKTQLFESIESLAIYRTEKTTFCTINTITDNPTGNYLRFTNKVSIKSLIEHKDIIIESINEPNPIKLPNTFSSFRLRLFP